MICGRDLMYSGMGDSAAFDGVSMTWADFNNDGFLDLFMGTAYGTVNDTTTVGFNNGFNSKIFFNDGTGKLAANTANVTSGISTGAVNSDSTKTYVFNDRSRGGGSVAVDWNADGKMDIIEIPFYAGANLAAGASQNVLLFTRNANTLTSTSNASNATSIYDQSTLINVLGTAATADAITGLLS